MPVSRTIAAPLRISAGGIAFTDDPIAQAVQRVYSVLSTQPGERVMRPTYGADTMQYLYALDDELDRAEFVDTVRNALQQFAPDVKFVGCIIDDVADSKGNVTVRVSFALPNSVDDSTVLTQTITVGTVSVNGTVKESS